LLRRICGHRPELTESEACAAQPRGALGWTAVGLYAATRLGVVVVGNLHISEYNRMVRLRLGMTAARTDGH
jgi:hypothetical protein